MMIKDSALDVIVRKTLPFNQSEKTGWGALL